MGFGAGQEGFNRDMSTVLVTADYFDKSERAIELLGQICEGLEKDEIPMPPELLDWFTVDYKKDNETHMDSNIL